MRCFALLALVSATIGTSSAYVDAGDRTTVTVSANAYDDRIEAPGCRPSGCIPENTRDGSTHDESRWSCMEDLEDENCVICYDFAEAQDIISISIALFNSDEEYDRTLKVIVNGNTWSTIETSDLNSGYQTFDLDTDETTSLCLESLELQGDEWISITEVVIWVD